MTIMSGHQRIYDSNVLGVSRQRWTTGYEVVAPSGNIITIGQADAQGVGQISEISLSQVLEW
jgi:hypothetical protein